MEGGVGMGQYTWLAVHCSLLNLLPCCAFVCCWAQQLVIPWQAALKTQKTKKP